MRVKRKRRSEVTGMRLAPDVRKLLDLEVERTGRYAATIVSDLIRVHLPSEEDQEQPTLVASDAQ